MKPILFIIRGVPGSGKSTLACKLKDKLIQSTKMDVFHYEADQYFIRPNGVYDFNGRLLPDAHEWCKQRVRRGLEYQAPVIVSNTLTRRWEVNGYVDLAMSVGADAVILRCTGEFENVHKVPAEKIKQMIERFEDVDGENIVKPTDEIDPCWWVNLNG